MSKLTSVAEDRLAKKRQAAEAAKQHIEEVGKVSEKTEEAGKVPEKTEEDKRLSVDVPVSLHKQLKLAALNRGTTVRKLVVQALQDAYGQE